MKKMITYIGWVFIALWLFGAGVLRGFFEISPPGIYTVTDAIIDGALIVGVIFLIIGAVIKKLGASRSEKNP